MLQGRRLRLREGKHLAQGRTTGEGRIGAQAHRTSKTFFLPPHACESNITSLKGWKIQTTTDSQCYLLVATGFHPSSLYLYTLCDSYSFSRLPRYCGCSNAVSVSVRICDPGEQMASGQLDHHLGGSGGPCWLVCPWGTHQPCPLPALHTQCLLLPVRPEGRTGHQGWIWEPSRSCPVPTDPAPGQCGAMVRPLVGRARQN